MNTSIFKEKVCHFQITPVSGITVQFNQSKFNFFMTGCYKCRGFFGYECLINTVAVALYNRQKSFFSCGFGISDSRFNQMSGTVKLMVIADTENILRLNLLMSRIEVSVGALSLFH